MRTLQQRTGFLTTMTRIAHRHTVNNRPVPSGATDWLGGTDANENTDTDVYRLRTGLVGPASHYYIPPMKLIQETPLEFMKCLVKAQVPIPAWLRNLRESWLPAVFDSYFGMDQDPRKRPYTAHMFDDEREYLERFIRGMNYVDSPDFDIRRFSCIKRLYKMVGDNVNLCVTSRVFRVIANDSTNLATQPTHMMLYAKPGVYFNRSNRTLMIKTADRKLTEHRLRTDIGSSADTENTTRFLRRLAVQNSDLREEQLVGLFANVRDRLRVLHTTGSVTHYCEHGPGFTEAYFLERRLPDDFVERTKPRADEVPPIYSETVTLSTGTSLYLHTTYRDEMQVRKLYSDKLTRFLIPQLQTRKNADEQIALIAGFVSEMANAHIFNDANNRTWIQIILHHLLSRCRLPEAILAVPNGFAFKVRYDLGADADREPGSPGYLDAMRPAIQAIQDGQRYYASLCTLSSCKLANIAPQCWV